MTCTWRSSACRSTAQVSVGVAAARGSCVPTEHVGQESSRWHPGAQGRSGAGARAGVRRDAAEASTKPQGMLLGVGTGDLHLLQPPTSCAPGSGASSPSPDRATWPPNLVWIELPEIAPLRMGASSFLQLQH